MYDVFGNVVDYEGDENAAWDRYCDSTKYEVEHKPHELLKRYETYKYREATLKGLLTTYPQSYDYDNMGYFAEKEARREEKNEKNVIKAQYEYVKQEMQNARKTFLDYVGDRLLCEYSGYESADDKDYQLALKVGFLDEDDVFANILDYWPFSNECKTKIQKEIDMARGTLD